VLAFVRIVDGGITKGDEIKFIATDAKADSIEVGKFRPQLDPKPELKAGEVGYIATGLKSVEECRVGDTITSAMIVSETGKQKINVGIEALPGYKVVRPMVYASFYPVEGEDYNQMRDALDKLKLNDAALAFEGESSQSLGRGFRIGFLGLLHLEIVQERLKREFDFNPVITSPSVVYKIVKTDGSEKDIYSASEVPDSNMISEILEPMVKLDIISPAEYLGAIMKLVNDTTRAVYLSTEYLDKERIVLHFDAPLSEVIINFHDFLKSATSGFASMNYEVSGYQSYDLVRMDIYVAEDKIDAFSQIVPRENAVSEGRRVVGKLKDVIPRQNFLIKIQAAIGGKMIARENIKAYRKDVTGHLYGGDITRKRKLLEKQKKGKKRMTQSGKAEIPQKAFLAVMKK
jgi:GTP-binding protein LepA